MILKCTYEKDSLSINADRARTHEFQLSFINRIGIDGKDAYEQWLEHGYTGTIEEFVAWMQQPAVDAARVATTAAGNADRAAGAANQAAGLADTSRENLAETVDQKLTQVDQTMTAVDRAVGEAINATVEASSLAMRAAEQAVRDAETTRLATSGANTASGTATTAAGNANTKAQEAATQAQKATAAATLAEQKAALAATAATNADTATGNANTAASGADSAAEHATEVAAGMDGRMTAAEAEMFQLRTGKADVNPTTGATSALRALFVARGAVWNEKTGYYELNGLTDITESQMITIYNVTNSITTQNMHYFAMRGGVMNNASLATGIRTNFKFYDTNNSANAANIVFSFAYNTNLEVLSLERMFGAVGNKGELFISKWNYAFTSCSKLRSIIGVLNVSTNVVYEDPFNLMPELQDVLIKGLKYHLMLTSASKLTRGSILYLINNAINTSPITLTLHADAAARLTPEDIALASSKNITIA